MRSFLKKTLFFLVITVSILFGGNSEVTKEAYADAACGPGWICADSFTYLQVGGCAMNFGYCVNINVSSNTVPCSSGGGSCTASTPGRAGCTLNVETTCNCSDEVTKTCTHYTDCGDDGTTIDYKCSISRNTCSAAEVGQSCDPGDPYSSDICTAETIYLDCICGEESTCAFDTSGDTAQCCQSCNSSCVGKCGLTNDCGDPCPPCGTQVCGDGACTGTETCSNCALDCGDCCGQNGCTDPGEDCNTCALDCGACPPTPPPSSPPPSECGNGTCQTGIGENCETCATDCGPCTCGDGLCSPVAGENCYTCPTDCGSCCGNGACEAGYGENCYTCSTDCGGCCGNGICEPSYGETVITCPVDCDECGNGICDGFEACDICIADCGVCSTDNQAWWQATGGSVYAGQQAGYAIYSNVSSDSLCISPDCIASLITAGWSPTDLTYEDTNTAGIPITGGGGIEANTYHTQYPDNPYATASQNSLKENYTYFVKKYGMNVSSTAYTGNLADATKPDALDINNNQKPYLTTGSMTIQQLWDVPAGETIIIFVNGDLTMADPSSIGQLINVETGAFLAFIVSGDITIEDTVGNAIVVGNPELDDRTANIEGVFIADGQINIQSRVPSTATSDLRFIAEGTLVGWSGFNLERNFFDGTSGEEENGLRPTELFIYRPDLLENIPQAMKQPHYIWQETN